MPIDIQHLLQSQLARKRLVEHSNDVDALQTIGHYYFHVGRYSEAINSFERVIEHSASFDACFHTALAYRMLKRQNCVKLFQSAYRLATQPDQKELAVICLAEAILRKDASPQLIQIFGDTAIFDKAALDALASGRHLSEHQVAKFRTAQFFGAVLIYWSSNRWGELVQLIRQYKYVPQHPRGLRFFGLCLEACERAGETDLKISLFLNTLKFGKWAPDYRPRTNNSAFYNHFTKVEARQLTSERKSEDVTISNDCSAELWNTKTNCDGVADFSGIIHRAPVGALAQFVVSGAGDRSQGSAIVMTAECAISSQDLTMVRARASDLLPAQEYSVSLRVLEGEGKETLFETAPSHFSIETWTAPQFYETHAEAIGTQGMIVAAEIAASGSTNRYRFVARQSGIDVTIAAPWRPFPPPLNAFIQEKASDQFNNWVPRSSGISWEPTGDHISTDRPDPTAYALLMKAPYSKDRNQLSGIGSHEMPLNIGWCHPCPPQERFDQEQRMSLSASAGEIDLRDSEFSFFIKPQNLDPKSSFLSFWISRTANDAIGQLTSQWALTGQLFDHKAMTDGSRWHEVKLKLRNDPRQWTYTGNNPVEQGERAKRYRPLPLNETLKGNNEAFVLIFVCGNELESPEGNFLLSKVMAKFRCHSLLTVHAGAELIDFPINGRSPDLICNGSRGLIDQMWETLSFQKPTYPMTFEWRLKSPTRLNRLQINQHLQWPAKEIEIHAKHDSTWSKLWSGTLPNTISDRAKPNYQYLDSMPEANVSDIRLIIHSGYFENKVGLDGIEVYGNPDEVHFISDGRNFSASEEFRELCEGQSVEYWVEIDNGSKIARSKSSILNLPPDGRPQILEAHLDTADPRGPLIRARANAMGEETLLRAQIQTNDGDSYDSSYVSIGSQSTARHTILTLPDKYRGKVASFDLEAVNVLGKSSAHYKFESDDK